MRGDSRRRWCLFVFTLAFVLLTLNGRASAAGQYLAEFPLPPLYYVSLRSRPVPMEISGLRVTSQTKLATQRSEG